MAIGTHHFDTPSEEPQVRIKKKSFSIFRIFISMIGIVLCLFAGYLLNVVLGGMNYGAYEFNYLMIDDGYLFRCTRTIAYDSSYFVTDEVSPDGWVTLDPVGRCSSIKKLL